MPMFFLICCFFNTIVHSACEQNLLLLIWYAFVVIPLGLSQVLFLFLYVSSLKSYHYSALSNVSFTCWISSNVANHTSAEYFQNKLLETIQFMEILNLKDSVEKDTFFRKLPNLAEQLPREIVLKKVFPIFF